MGEPLLEVECPHCDAHGCDVCAGSGERAAGCYCDDLTIFDHGAYRLRPVHAESEARREERSDDAATEPTGRDLVMALYAVLNGGREVGRPPIPISNLEPDPHPCRVVLLELSGRAQLLGRAMRPDMAEAIAYAFIARTFAVELTAGARILSYDDEWNVGRAWRWTGTGWLESSARRRA